MQKLLSSASKLVFLLIAATACYAFIVGILSQDSFMILATGAFAFYFSNKGDMSEPFAGK